MRRGEALAGQSLLLPQRPKLFLTSLPLHLLLLGDFYLFFRIPFHFPPLTRALSLTLSNIPHPGQVT